MSELDSYTASSGTLVAVWTVSVQTIPGDVDRILDAVVAVEPLEYGKYGRNASITAVGLETARPPSGTTTATHIEDFVPGSTETYPMVELTMSIARDLSTLERVMDAIHHVHHYEEPVILVREGWASRAAYDPTNDNPNRWWNRPEGLTGRIDDIAAFLTR